MAPAGWQKNSNGLELKSINWDDWRCTISSLSVSIDRKRRALLTEASLLARQFSNQLPELGESQLPVVVFIQWAHELVDDSGITGILQRVITKNSSGSIQYNDLRCSIIYFETLSCHLMVEWSNKNTRKAFEGTLTKFLDHGENSYEKSSNPVSYYGHWAIKHIKLLHYICSRSVLLDSVQSIINFIPLSHRYNPKLQDYTPYKKQLTTVWSINNFVIIK